MVVSGISAAKCSCCTATYTRRTGKSAHTTGRANIVAGDIDSFGVDTEIALLIVKKRKKEEINASKIYSPVGRFAERVK